MRAQRWIPPTCVCFSSSFYSRSIERICYCRHAYTDGSNGRPFRATSNGSPSVKITREKVLMNDDFTFVLKHPRWTSLYLDDLLRVKEFHLKWTERKETFTSARKRSWTPPRTSRSRAINETSQQRLHIWKERATLQRLIAVVTTAPKIDAHVLTVKKVLSSSFFFRQNTHKKTTDN